MIFEVNAMVKRKNRRTLIVISAGLLIIAATAVMIVINLIRDVDSASSDWASRVMIGPKYAFMVFPVILEELLLLRSIYKLIHWNPKRTAKICYILSASLVLAALVFQILVNTRVITASVFPNNGKAGAPSSQLVITFIATEWIAILASFILGSLNPKPISIEVNGGNEL